MTELDGRRQWWDGTVGYEIYIRSFADSNGDGIGDLAGVGQHLDHLVWLGVDSLWVTPFYPSPGHDHGYDVSDYCAVNPIHGTLDDFDALVGAAHERDLRVLIDLVANHTSSEHPWFREARSSKDNPYRDFYLWRDPGPGGGPPNNWVSHFGGPAWTLDEDSGQYWCHLFLPEQPDLNWANPAVAEAFDDILRFWCERGVDGFRIDVAHGMTKDPQMRDNPQIGTITDQMGSQAVFGAFEHRHDLDQDDNVEVFARWHRTVEPYGAALVGEVSAPTPERMARYTTGGALDTVFFLQPCSMPWEPHLLLGLHREMHDADPRGVSWVLNNHDQPRSPSRFGGGPRGAYRSLALTTLQFALGGVPFLYQGEELGLDNARLPPGEREDPIWTRNHVSSEVGRDVARSPMPWTTGDANGFSDGTPWLEAEDRPRQQTVEGQAANPDAIVHRYRELLALRRSRPEMWSEPLEWLTPVSRTAVALRRGSILVVANLGPDPVVYDTGVTPDVLFVSNPSRGRTYGTRIQVDPETTVVAGIGTR